MSSSASYNTGDTVFGLPVVVCHCGSRATVKTCWRAPNAGRRFYCCGKSPGGGCRMREWAEEEMCQRSQALVPGLLRKCDALEEKNAALEEKNAALDQAKQSDENEIGMLKKKIHIMKKENKILYAMLAILTMVLGAMAKALLGAGKVRPTGAKELNYFMYGKFWCGILYVSLSLQWC